MATITYTKDSTIFTAAEDLRDAEDIIIELIQLGHMSAIITALEKLGYPVPEDWGR